MKINREKLKILGKGMEKIVYEDPNDTNRAIGFFHEYRSEPPEIVKGRFYLTKILHLLFPKNIPDIHMVSSNPNALVVDKIDGDSVPPDNLKKFVSAYYELRDKLSDLDIPADSAHINYKFDTKGDFYYVDSFNPWSRVISHENLNFDLEKIRMAINGLESDKRELAISYLDRLLKLYKEFLEKLNKGK